jgi:hypothetical protein
MVDGLAVQTLVGEMAEGRMMTLLVDWMAVKLGLDGEQRTYAYARAHYSNEWLAHRAARNR